MKVFSNFCITTDPCVSGGCAAEAAKHQPQGDGFVGWRHQFKVLVLLFSVLIGLLLYN